MSVFSAARHSRKWILVKNSIAHTKQAKNLGVSRVTQWRVTLQWGYFTGGPFGFAFVI